MNLDLPYVFLNASPRATCIRNSPRRATFATMTTERCRLLIVPLGAVSVGFIMIQPPLIGALCALCILQAAITVVLVPYSIDEVLATCQYLYGATRAGEPFWRTFWRGGPALSENQTPEPDLDRPAGVILREFVTGGVNFPWTLVAGTALGSA